MYKTNSEGLVVDADERPLAVPVDSFVTGLGVESESALVILRLYRKNWATYQGKVPGDRVHQFVLDAGRAAELGRELLSYAAQVEKEMTNQDQH